MKLVVAVIQDYDTNDFLKALSHHGIMATRIASAGGFLRQGNTTVFSAVDDDQVLLVKQLLSRHCGNRADTAAEDHFTLMDASEFEHFAATRIGGGVAFVAKISHFEKVVHKAREEEAASVAADQ